MIKILNSIKNWLKKKPEENDDAEIKLSFHDRPIRSTTEDYFEVGKGTVNRIYKLIHDSPFSPLTIAITGEWGIGKTSVINLLCNKLNINNKNIILKFDPLLEGGTEIKDILESFYFKLYAALNKNHEIKQIIKKSLKSILLLTKHKTSFNANITPGASVGIEYDFGKNLDSILKLWEQEQPKSISEQTHELNKLLKKHQYKLYIIIDEIDRLNADNIINFLLFARILEVFDNVICIIGMDYQQTLNKLINEGKLGLCNYESAKAYVDKLFQSQFLVHINRNKKIEYAISWLKKIDNENIFSSFLSTQEYRVYTYLYEIIDYLSTPRQIKKWLIAIEKYYSIITNAQKKLDFLAFLAVIIKHPIIFDNFSKKTLPILTRNKFLSIRTFIEDNHKINFSAHNDSEEFDKNILMVSIGLTTRDTENSDPLKELLKTITTYEIIDRSAEIFVKDFLETVPVSLMTLLIEGSSDDKKITAYQDFFEGEIDNTFNVLLGDNSAADLLAYDLSESLNNMQIITKNKPSIKLLNDLWQKRVGDDLGFGNPYVNIILVALGTLTVEDIITSADLILSERYIGHILTKFNIYNRNGEYHFKDFKLDLSQSNYIITDNLIFKNKKIRDFERETIKEILLFWSENVNKKLSENKSFLQCGLISVFYRYIQWGNLLETDNRYQLSTFLLSYLTDPNIDPKDKERVISLIVEECAKYQNPLGAKPQKSPLELLFNNNSKLLDTISSHLKENNSIKYISSFNKTRNVNRESTMIT